MAFSPGFVSRFFVGSQRWSLYARAMNADVTVAQIDISSLEDLAQVFANGQRGGSVSLDMMLDGVAAGQFTLANTWQSTPQPLTLGFAGAAITNTVWMVLGNQSSAAIASTLADVSTIKVQVQPDGGVEWGVVIAPEAAITVDTNGTSVDNGTSTTNGGVAHLHATAFSGLTSNSVIIEHSANDSVWATLGTFASVTAAASERLVIAAGTTVNRYLRIRDGVTGTGSCTRAAAFARR